MRLNSRCVLAVAVGERYVMQAIVMASSFLEYNAGWDVVIYTDALDASLPWWAIIRPLSSQLMPHREFRGFSPFDQCEIGRFLAVKALLDDYDEVLYCDNDLYWYAPYTVSDTAELILSPHFLNPSIALANVALLWRDGGPNIGHMHFRGRRAVTVCDYIISEVKTNPMANRHKGTLWLQNLMTMAPWLGLDTATTGIGCNVGNWNLRRGDREIMERDGAFIVRCGGLESPLVSYHFSGKSFARLIDGQLGPIPARLAREYADRLAAGSSAATTAKMRN